jgi:hypothetical protein
MKTKINGGRKKKKQRRKLCRALDKPMLMGLVALKLEHLGIFDPRQLLLLLLLKKIRMMITRQFTGKMEDAIFCPYVYFYFQDLVVTEIKFKDSLV